jgi:hypothetical protein
VCCNSSQHKAAGTRYPTGTRPPSQSSRSGTRAWTMPCNQGASTVWAYTHLTLRPTGCNPATIGSVWVVAADMPCVEGFVDWHALRPGNHSQQRTTWHVMFSGCGLPHGAVGPGFVLTSGHATMIHTQQAQHQANQHTLQGHLSSTLLPAAVAAARQPRLAPSNPVREGLCSASSACGTCAA